MQIIQAQQSGVAAYRAGQGRAPALNQVFIAAACASATSTASLLQAYLYGWDIANLANGSGDPTMPSVITLAEIDGAVAL